MRNFLQLISLTVSILLITANVLCASVERFRYDSKGKRDPFIALVTPEGRILPGARSNAEQESVALEGVIWDPNGNSLAIINGKLTKVGQRVYGLELLKINKQSIIMQKKGQVKIFYLKQKGGEVDGNKN